MLRFCRMSGLLGVLGLGESDEAIYRCLLEDGPSTVPRLAALSDITPAITRVTLGRLESMGLISSTEGRPVRYSATPPSLGLTGLVVDREQQLAHVRLEIERLQAGFERGGGRSRSAGLVEVVEGRSNILTRMDQLYQSATQEILSLDKPPYTRAPTENVVEQSHLASGVTYRAVYSRESLNYPGGLAAALSFIEAGEDARLLPDVPMKLHIFDRRVALLPLVIGEAGTIEGHLIVYSSELLRALIVMWEGLYERAVPLNLQSASSEEPPSSIHQLGEDDERLARLLLTGAKTEFIARELHVAVATAERRIKRLMETLDATSRFQAGFQLARLLLGHMNDPQTSRPEGLGSRFQ